MVRVGALVLVAGALAGCARGAADPAPPAIVVEFGRERPDFGVVSVRGLDRALLRELARRAPDDMGWRDAFVVTAAEGLGVPPLAGTYGIVGDEVRFVPQFPPHGPLRYRVRLDVARLAELAGRDVPAAAAIEREFEVPAAPVPPRTTVVSAVYPSVAVLPANQLRWYLEFSAPMSEGEAYRRVHLLDERGREVTASFLVVEQELWDRERRRLTLFFDPGRVKRGIRTNMESGAPVRAGRRYTLRVDAEWRDGRGAPLASAYEKHFHVVAADRRRPEPARWRLTPPPLGSRAPLEVEFGEPLDHALAARLLAVVDAAGRPFPGAATLADDDRRWRFVPAARWMAGRYSVRVSPELEDLAGNSVRRVFDLDLDRAKPEAGPAELGFSPVPSDGRSLTR